MNVTRSMARYAFRCMMATETGEPVFMDRAEITNEEIDDMIYERFSPQAGTVFAETVFAECQSWLPALYHADGTAAPLDVLHRVQMGKAGWSGRYITKEPCQRCGGAGGFSHWPGYTCYRCGDHHSHIFETVPHKVYTKAGLARLLKQRQAKAVRDAEKRAAAEREQAVRFNSWVAAGRQDLAEALYSYNGASDFIESMAALLRVNQPLTERQEAAVRDALANAAARAAANAKSRHLGSVRDRLTLDVTVTFVRDLEGFQGRPKRLVKMTTADGDVVVTFSTSDWVWDAKPGMELRITGTVKDHDTYADTEQTVLTRTKRED